MMREPKEWQSMTVVSGIYSMPGSVLSFLYVLTYLTLQLSYKVDIIVLLILQTGKSRQ